MIAFMSYHPKPKPKNQRRRRNKNDDSLEQFIKIRKGCKGIKSNLKDN